LVDRFWPSNDGNLANVIGGGSSVRFDVLAQNAGATLTVTAPDGRSFSKEFRAGAALEFNLATNRCRTAFTITNCV
jgi:hypothetical protein